MIGNDCSNSTAILRFGLISDIQYADVEDAYNYHKTARRYYRAALPCLKKAVDHWTNTAQPPLDFVVSLGDVIDGKNNKRVDTFDSLLSQFNRLSCPVHHCIGNHELYNFSPKTLYEKLVLPNVINKNLFSTTGPKMYYDFSLGKNVRFVVLNSYGFSVLGSPTDSAERAAALDFVKHRNPNEDLNSSNDMYGPDQRFVQYGGGIDNVQLEWLRHTLDLATENNERVVVFTHLPVHPGTTPPNCLLWNYENVLERLQASKSVVAVFGGHCHSNGHVKDQNGIHFVVLTAVLECAPPTENAFANVLVHPNGLEIIGNGTKIPNRYLAFRTP